MTTEGGGGTHQEQEASQASTEKEGVAAAAGSANGELGLIQDQGVHCKWTPDHDKREDPQAEHQRVPLPERQALQNADQTPKKGPERDNESGVRRIIRR